MHREIKLKTIGFKLINYIKIPNRDYSSQIYVTMQKAADQPQKE